MLDLEAGVHLEEVEATLGVDDELDRSGRVIAGGAGEPDRLGAHRPAGRLVEQRARCLLDDLLMAALDRALALAQMDDVPLAIAQNLDLDMPRLGDEFLEEHPIVAEGRAGFASRALECLAQVALAERDAHALAAAARGRLDHHREADRLRNARRQLRLPDRFGVSRDDADPGLLREPLGFDLVAHQPDRAGRRADEGDALGLERFGEDRVLGQKAVAGVDRLGAAAARGGDDRVDPEVALGRRWRANRDRLVGHAHVRRVEVRLRADRHGRDAQPAAGPDHPAGDLAAIGDQDLCEHPSGPSIDLARPIYGAAERETTTPGPRIFRHLTCRRDRMPGNLLRYHRAGARIGTP